MEAKAIARFVRISPRKVKSVVDEIRGKQVDEALAMLKNAPRKSAPIVEKVLNSAIANAENNNDLSREKLIISEIYANQGPTIKRFRPRAQGRATMIRKRTSHIGITVKEI